jgi:hypothetical protein
MNRSDIIAQVLVRSELYSTIADAKAFIVQTFEKDFPEKDYNAWDQPVSEADGNALVKSIGIKTTQTLSIRNFIEDLEKILSEG